MSLRSLPSRLAAILLCSLLAVSAAGLERVVINHDYVVARAQKLAGGAYQARGREAPRFFKELGYDDYRAISFKADTALWQEAPNRFHLGFYHPGWNYSQMVKLNEFTDSHAQPIPFARNFFDYGRIDVPLLSRWGLEFAGFRLFHELNEHDRWEEVVSFLGASHYRAVGRRQVYGASARGLAINAGGPGPEEFPAFVEFWIRKPASDATAITVHALLDGPSVTGAYTFVITPGAETVMEARATLFFRRPVAQLGLVPLSTMFWFGEGTATRFGDFRPEVHDSDGLLVATDAKTRVWRPLLNPTGVAITDIDAPALAGFGLLQRDRDFRSYEDPEGSFERRPGVWVEPVGTWPPGRVRLVETPATNERVDNVTAFWAPRDAVPAGRPFEIAWRQRWTYAATFGGPAGWISATRQTQQDGGPDKTKYVIDFDPRSLSGVPADAELVADVAVTGGGSVRKSEILRNMANGSRRVVVSLQSAGSGPVETRVRLLHDQQPVTETWTTRWQP